MAAKYLLLYPINYCFRKRTESAIHSSEADEAKAEKLLEGVKDKDSAIIHPEKEE